MLLLDNILIVLGWKRKEPKYFQTVQVENKLAKKSFKTESDSLDELAATTSLDACISAYTGAESGSIIERRAMEKIKKIARTFNDWLSVHNLVSPKNPLGVFAEEQLFSLACTFANWKCFYHASSDENMRSVALEKIAACAHTLEERVEVCELAPEGSSTKTSLLASLKFQAKSLEDWIKILDSAESGSGMERFAAGMVVDMTPDDPVELCELLKYDVISEDSDLNKKVLTKLKSIKSVFEKWQSCYRDAEDDEIQKLASKKMLEEADSVKKLQTTEEIIDTDYCDDEFCKSFEVKAKSVTFSDEECHSILDREQVDSNIFNAALEHLICRASTTRQFLDIYLSLLNEWNQNDDDIDDFLSKVAEKMFSVATKDEIYIISKFNEESGDLADEAEKRLK